MISRRLLLGAGAVALLLSGLPSRAVVATASASATVVDFYRILLSVMKQAGDLGFSGRYERLDPAARRAFDFPLMAQLIVGPQWQNLTHDQQQQIVDAFANFSIATYASRFDGYSGERFVVDPAPRLIGSDVIIHSQLFRTDGDPVTLDYLMRQSSATWRIIDVYLSGTISELAVRRSEFNSVLRRSGPDGLIDVLRRRVEQLKTHNS